MLDNISAAIFSKRPVEWNHHPRQTHPSGGASPQPQPAARAGELSDSGAGVGQPASPDLTACKTSRLPVEVVFFQFLVERIAIDPQFGGRFGLHVVAGVHHLSNQLAFHPIHDLRVQAVFIRTGGG